MTRKPYDPAVYYNPQASVLDVPSDQAPSLGEIVAQGQGQLFRHQHFAGHATFLASLCQDVGVIELTYRADAGAGTFIKLLKLVNYGRLPIVLTFFLGTVDTVTGAAVDSESGGMMYRTWSVTGGNIQFDWDERVLQLAIASSNVGYANPIKARVAFFVLNDLTELEV